jgi:cephalosporin hydroxylase
MSTEKIYGGWDTILPNHDFLSKLWHTLAAQKVGTPDQRNNSGLSQRRCEITALWEIFRRMQPKLVVEIGVAQGGTFAGWCQLSGNDTLLIGIDRDVNDCLPRPGEPVHINVSNNRRLSITTQGGGMYALAIGNQRVVPINGWSTEPSVINKLNDTLAGRQIEFLFHDASHSSTMFAEDWKLYWPMIADGGVFAAHDINWSADPNCDKSVEWERIKREETYSACYEFLPHRSVSEMGIGLVIR